MVFSVTVNQENKIIKSTNPVVDSDDICLFFSGIIYNKDFLKREYTLESNTPECIIHELFKIQKYLPKIISLINGIFSIVVIDRTTNTLVAIRDRNGVGNLIYYLEPSGDFTFSDTVLDKTVNYRSINPGEIVSFNDGEITDRNIYNSYEQQYEYWQSVRDRYVVTKHKQRFKNIGIAGLTTDQIISFSNVLIDRAKYPEKVDMFKFIQAVKLFEICEFTKLYDLMKRAVKIIVDMNRNACFFVLLDDSVETIFLIILLKEFEVEIKTFSVHDEFEFITPPRVVGILNLEDHSMITHNSATTRTEINSVFGFQPSLKTELVYVFCKHIGQVSEAPVAMFTTLAEDFFTGNIISNLTSSNSVFETSLCLEKFNIEGHFPYADIHLGKYCLFLNNRPRVVRERQQEKYMLKIAFSQYTINHEHRDALCNLVFNVS